MITDPYFDKKNNITLIMGKKALPDLTTCCGVMSVKMGTYLIAVFNQAAAMIGFVANISIIIIKTNDISSDDYPLSKTELYSLITLACGILATAAHVAMGIVLIRGLIKESSGYLRWYLVIGPGVIGINMVLIGCSIFLVHWINAIPTFFGIAVEAYFLLVIRSAYREMVMEEKAFVATRNNLSREDYHTEEI